MQQVRDAFIYSALNYELKGRLRHKYKLQTCYQRESVTSMAMIIKMTEIFNIWFNVLGRKCRCGDYYCEANVGECQYCLYMPNGQWPNVIRFYVIKKFYVIEKF